MTFSRRLIFSVLVAGSVGCSGSTLVTGYNSMLIRSAGLSEGKIRVDDHEIAYLRGGQGPTILMVHGFAANKENWLKFSKFFTDDFDVIAIDLPGFGSSSRKEDGDYSIQAQARRLHALVQALDLNRFHIVGNSMGAHLSAYYASVYPGRAQSLALFANSGVRPPSPSAVQLAYEAGENPLRIESIADYERVLKLLFVDPPSMPNSVKRHFADVARRSADFRDRIRTKLIEESEPLEPYLGKIDLPALVVWGNDDALIDVSAAHATHAALQGSRLVVVPECGHAPMIEKAEETADHYRRFIQSTTAEAGGRHAVTP